MRSGLAVVRPRVTVCPARSDLPVQPLRASLPPGSRRESPAGSVLSLLRKQASLWWLRSHVQGARGCPPGLSHWRIASACSPVAAHVSLFCTPVSRAAAAPSTHPPLDTSFFPGPGCCQQCCSEPWGASVFLN